MPGGNWRQSGAQQWKKSKPRALSAAGEREGREAGHSSVFKAAPAPSCVEGSTAQIEAVCVLQCLSATRKMVQGKDCCFTARCEQQLLFLSLKQDSCCSDTSKEAPSPLCSSVCVSSRAHHPPSPGRASPSHQTLISSSTTAPGTWLQWGFPR